MDWKRIRSRAYIHICRFRILWLLASLGGSGLSAWGAYAFLQEERWLPGGLCLAGAVPFLLCLSFLSWFFPTLRFIRWWTLRQFHKSWRWLTRPGHLLAGVALVVLVAWTFHQAEILSPRIGIVIVKKDGQTMLIPQSRTGNAAPPWEKSLQLGLELLALGALLALVRETAKARSRMVIQPFVDHTAGPEVSDPVRKARGEALSSLLRSEIAGITALYKIIDEVSPSKTSVEATVGVADVGERLKEAIGPDWKEPAAISRGADILIPSRFASRVSTGYSPRLGRLRARASPSRPPWRAHSRPCFWSRKVRPNGSLSVVSTRASRTSSRPGMS